METNRSQRGRAGKTVESSADADEGRAAEYAEHTPSGETNGDVRTPEAQGARALEGAPLREESEATSGTLRSLMGTSMRDNPVIGSSSPQTTTTILEIDADDWIDKDLEALSATDQPRTGDATASRTAPAAAARRFPYLDLRMDERLGRILLSVVLAVLLWFYVFNLENPPNSTSFTGLTIKPTNAANQLRVIKTFPDVVDATVQGPKNVLNSLVKSDIQPYIDLTNVPAGVHEVSVQVNLDPNKWRGLTVIFSPSNVQVQLEQQVVQVFTVSAQTNGTPAVGYVLEDIQIDPKQISVTGLRSDVLRIVKVIVPVDVEGRASTQQGSKTPIALDDNGQRIEGLLFGPLSVKVVAPIKLISTNRVVTTKANLIGQPAAGYEIYSITIDPTNVTICCSPNLEKIAAQLETAPIAITGTTSTVITSTKLMLPQGADLLDNQSKQVTVTVIVRPIETSIKLSVAPTIQGVAPGYNAELSPGQIDLTLSGTINQLQGVSPATVQAVISAEGRGAGTYSVKPQISVPSGVKVEGFTPDQLTLTLLAQTPLPTRTLLPQPTGTQTVEAETSVTPVTTRGTTPVATAVTPTSAPAAPTQTAPVGTVTASPIVSQTTHTPEAQTAPTATVGQP